MTPPPSISADSAQPNGGLSLRLWPQLTALMLVMVELGWILPWYRMVIQVSYVAPLPVCALVLGGIMLAAYGVAHTLENLRLLKNVQLGVLLALLAASLIFAESALLNGPFTTLLEGLTELTPGAVLIVITVVWLWWRGLTLAREAIRPMMAWRRFELGLLLFMAYLFIVTQQGQAAPGLAWLVAFLFTGFQAVIFARISYVGITKGVRKNPFDRRWLLSTVSILGAIIAIAAFLGGLLTGQYRLLLDFLGEGFKLLVAVFLFIVAIPALLLSNLFGPLIPWLKQFMATPSATSEAEQAPTGPAVTEPIEQVMITPFIESVCFWTIIIIIIVALFIRVRAVMVQNRAKQPEEPVSLLKRGEASRLFRKALEDAIDSLASHLRPAQRLLAAARIRRIYTQLMDLCAELDQARPAAKTPVEFLPTLGEIFPQLITDLELITDAYVRVRYGEYPEAKEEVEAVETAWKRVAEQGESIKKASAGLLKRAENKDVQRNTGV